MTGFRSTERYIASRDLEVAVNAAVALQRPLLVKGEPGTGKTVLAHEVAAALGYPLVEWHVKSTTKAQQGLYEYDAVSRLRDSQLGDPKVADIANYIVRGKLWDAFDADRPQVVLIDEIDKADIEFPNDLLLELDRMQFFVYETRQTVAARHRPVVIITSNNEKELPDAFLRRCFFHYIRFPDRPTMERIVDAHYPGLQSDLAREALNVFFQVREVPGRLANPVWVDDESFDLTYHVRQAALPRPGTDEQLEEFVARRRQKRLAELMGKLEWDPSFDLKTERSRSGK